MKVIQEESTRDDAAWHDANSAIGCCHHTLGGVSVHISLRLRLLAPMPRHRSVCPTPTLTDRRSLAHTACDCSHEVIEPSLSRYFGVPRIVSLLLRRVRVASVSAFKIILHFWYSRMRCCAPQRTSAGPFRVSMLFPWLLGDVAQTGSADDPAFSLPGHVPDEGKACSTAPLCQECSWRRHVS